MEKTVSFNREVRPILSENCYNCHGFDPSTRKAKRRLDTFEGATAERNGVRAIVPGNPEASDAWLRVSSEFEDEVMPPADSHKTLSREQKETLRRWIAQGAAYEPHWAFVAPPAVVPVPRVENQEWSRNEIDRFVLARLEAENLAPTHEASRERWLRRVTFDLTGLPPTQPEMDSFIADRSPRAYDAVVDRLLASPRFGERMAVPWLDLARYADSYGYQADLDTHAWPYRDWVIRALNANLPWDQFITWQLAGDLLPSATREQKLATAFNRIHRKNNEAGSVPEEFRQEAVSDRVHTFGTVFLGLTFECARCHDHKFDPISARDYYSLGAFFNSIDEFGLLQNGDLKKTAVSYPALPLPSAEQERALAAHRANVSAFEEQLRRQINEREANFRRWLEAAQPPGVSADLAAHFALDGTLPPVPPAVAKKQAPQTGKEAAEGMAAATTGNRFVAGRSGQAVLCTGDDPIAMPDFDIRHVEDPMSFAFWLRPSETYARAVVLANGAAADATCNGYELLLEDGRLRWSVIREYPGNCVSLRTEAALPTGAWTHVVITYDGSMRSAGMRIFLNGRRASTTVVRDGLTRDFVSGKAIEMGARFRDSGLRNGTIDDIRVFRRAITELEADDLHSGTAFLTLLARRDHSADELARLRAFYFSAVDPAARETTAKLHEARRGWREIMDEVPEISVMEETQEPRPAFVLDRGAYDAPGEPVERAAPSALPPLAPGAPRNRLGLAQWLTAPAHPLTGRVFMNRLWQEFFGRGLVATVDNFGVQGSAPSHPELLDWLARDFIAHGWDYKRACRQIVLSATYRQDSRVDPALRERDPDNILLARGPARRLTAEMLRDAALALGGLLRPELGGPPALPYQPEGSMWKALNNFLPVYKADTGAGLYRRSLYTFWRRTTTPPNMIALDAATRDICTARRQTTSTPLQALVLLNDPQFVEAARALGARMLRKGGATRERQLAWAFREITGRAPVPAELPLLTTMFEEQRAIFQKDPPAAARLLKVGMLPADPSLPPVDLAAATATAGAIFNLDASIMLR